MSPNEQKITSGREAISSALSISSSGVTQTGQPGPWIISICSGISWSMPCRMIECVWPPQTSISAQGWVTVAWMSSSSRWASSGSLNSSMYFIAAPRPRPCAPRFLGRAAHASPNSMLELAHPLEVGQRLLGRLLVQPLQGETDVHDRVVADRDVGHELAGRPPSPPRRSRPWPSACRPSPRYPAPRQEPLGTSRSPLLPENLCPDDELAEGDAGVARRHRAMPQHRKPRVEQPVDAEPRSAAR